MYFAATLLASLIVSTTGLVTPHYANGGLHRRHAAIAKVRAVDPAPAPVSPVASAAIPKRNLRKRCKPRKTPSPIASTEAPAATSPPENVAPLPPTVSSSSQDAPAPSSSQDAPPPSSSQDHPAPSPTPSPTSSKQQSKPAPTPEPSSPPPSSGDGGTREIHTGQGTFYATGLGACGITNNDNQPIAAASKLLFDTFPGYVSGNPNNNPLCGRHVIAEYQGKRVEVEITDRCEACAFDDLDFSPAAFNKLADPSVGRISGMQWWFTS